MRGQWRGRFHPSLATGEMCRVVDTVLVDQETVYAPRQGNPSRRAQTSAASSACHGVGPRVA
jgi:hypothetical protein